jgi:hypothetical protein
MESGAVNPPMTGFRRWLLIAALCFDGVIIPQTLGKERFVANGVAMNASKPRQ